MKSEGAVELALEAFRLSQPAVGELSEYLCSHRHAGPVGTQLPFSQWSTNHANCSTSELVMEPSRTQSAISFGNSIRHKIAGTYNVHGRQTPPAPTAAASK